MERERRVRLHLGTIRSGGSRSVAQTGAVSVGAKTILPGYGGRRKQIVVSKLGWS